ncbi:hypothetical protein ACIRYZ_01360 [Kitasatospora sp. NPDC101155]|uniref:hypothetical protein n=1 Tax=Kitasatospora sp. NPDC101155 TaxID=3364097 RepID=UPI00381D3175
MTRNPATGNRLLPALLVPAVGLVVLAALTAVGCPPLVRKVLLAVVIVTELGLIARACARRKDR